jgi:hypothetical protein
MTPILIAILRFPPILNFIRIGLATVAEWSLYRLLEILPWGEEYNYIASLIIIAAGILLFLYLFKLVLRDVRDLCSWFKNWWNGNEPDDSDNIL